MIRVLLVDDHAVVRMGFRLLLQSVADLQVLAEAESGEAACRMYLELNPDVVVMDLAMPGMGGSRRCGGFAHEIRMRACSRCRHRTIPCMRDARCKRARWDFCRNAARRRH